MRNKFLLVILLLISTLFLFNCSEIKDDITEPEKLDGVHPEGFGTMGSDNFHIFKIQSNKWDLTACQKCHASDYAGGTTGVSCFDCHTSSAGPEACNTCHGNFSDENRIAPPTDLANKYETSAKGVGAHTAHVYETKIALGVGCYTCHPGHETSSNYITSHSDGLPAEMSLAGYNATDLTCSDTYCHGNFEFNSVKGNNFSPIWNVVDGTQAACGTCHGKDGTPTPKGHSGNYTETQCKNCHADTFNEDGSLNKFIHMNGEANIAF
jgi:predicted CxxxxCH...CXXCH cytochrome family protein